MGGRPQFPLTRYSWPVATGGGSGGIAMYAAEQAASQLPVWAALPWEVVAIFAIGWLFGLLYADCLDADSQLRRWWRGRKDFGAFGRPTFIKSYFDPGADHGGKQSFIDIIVPFEFVERTKVINVRITVIKHNLLNDQFSRYAWSDAAQGIFFPSDRIDILLARIAIDPRYHGFYGDLSNAYITVSQEHAFRIEIFSKKHVQPNEIYMKVPHDRRDIAIQGNYDGNRFFLVEGGRRPFERLAEQLHQSESRRTILQFIARRH